LSGEFFYNFIITYLKKDCLSQTDRAICPFNCVRVLRVILIISCAVGGYLNRDFGPEVSIPRLKIACLLYPPLNNCRWGVSKDNTTSALANSSVFGQWRLSKTPDIPKFGDVDEILAWRYKYRDVQLQYSRRGIVVLHDAIRDDWRYLLGRYVLHKSREFTLKYYLSHESEKVFFCKPFCEIIEACWRCLEEDQ